jgi:hypothetical protein
MSVCRTLDEFHIRVQFLQFLVMLACISYFTARRLFQLRFSSTSSLHNCLVLSVRLRFRIYETSCRSVLVISRESTEP